MQTLGIALLIAWITVGGDLLPLPPTQLDIEVAVTGQMLEELKASPLLEIPEVKKQIDSSKRMVADPSARRIGLWTKWSMLFVLVMFGLWTAYAVIRRHNEAMTLMLIGALLFLGKPAIFDPGFYERMLEGTERIPWFLENGYFQYAVSFVWYTWILPVFFLFLTVFSSLHLVRNRPRISPFAGP